MARTKRGVVSRAKHKKVLKTVKVNLAEEKTLSVLLVKLWKKQCSMLTEIEKRKKRI